jgi:L-lactate dehydrogenase
MDLNPKLGQEDDCENLDSIHKQIVDSAYEIIKCKGYTNWAIGISVTEIVRSIIKNENRVFALSTNMDDWPESVSLLNF